MTKIDPAAVASAHTAIQPYISAVDEAAAALSRALANFTLHGLEHAAKAGVEPFMLGRVFHYLGIAKGHADAVIAAWGGAHHELHKVVELVVVGEPQPLGGGGGKGDQPPV